MNYETIVVAEDERGVVSLSLNLPEKRNALSAVMIAELTDVAARVNGSHTARAVVLSGAGDLFCAGGDLTWMMAQVRADRETRIKEASKLAHMLQALNTMRAPLIGKIHGAAFGGGLGITAICDVAIAVEGTKFGFTETKLGIIPATIGPYVVNRMGEGCARRVFMSARIFDANEARTLGLVTAVVRADEAGAAVEAEVAPYLKVAPGAVGRAKALIRTLGPRIDDAAITETVKALADAWESKEAEDGIAAFLEKRPPPWAQGK